MPAGDKVRVYDLARELGLTNKELLALLEKEGFAVKSHSSNIDAEVANIIRDMVIAERQQKKGKSQVQEKSESKESASKKPSSTVFNPLGKPPVKPVPPKTEEPAAEKEASEGPRELHLKTPITVRDLSAGLNVRPNELITRLMGMNVFAAINQVLDEDVVTKVCDLYNVKFVRLRRDRQTTVEEKAEKEEEKTAPENRVPRPPVVVFMGHVDHGKTSIQDYIRKTHVTQGESGGITQHIGASVATVGKQTITFLDTPGHEAFTAMRARGANATDIAVLVVAADDGVMPQTIEAINHAKAANVPIIVAMNKMDLPQANPNKVMVGLQQHGILSEDLGGDVAIIPVSAKTGQGIPDLLERILLEAEMLELTADPDANFKGLVIEAQMEQGMGPTASVLVQNGTLRVGDVLLCGKCWGRVKALVDGQGRRIAKALPSTPIRIMGLNAVPEAGDTIVKCENEREAKEKAEQAVQAEKDEALGTRQVSLEDFFNQTSQEELPELKLILKTDVRGSLEAIVDSIAKIKSDRVKCSVIHSGVGEVTENDVILAAASNAIIVGFHVRTSGSVNKLAKQKGVEIRLYAIIYELLEQVENAMRGKLAPEIKEKYLGRAEIIQIFENSKVGRICGCRVTDGLIRVNAKAKVFRDKELIYHGQIQNLKHFKDDVREMKSGLECGIKLDNFEDFIEHDVIEVYESVSVAPEL
ncbi:MAG: translation initiation factor IF-2 [Victivallales bacterium]|nr:translation initiation factor IF-2 [Victivallales bacterium]